MDLTPYLESVRHGVANAAALADDNTQQVAHRLGTAMESSTRLALIEALSDAAGTISAELAPTSVEVRMSGQDPEFVVSVPAAPLEPTLLRPDVEEPAMDEPDLEDEPMARISLRLPNSVKVKVDEMADRDGISTNAWLIRAVLDALAERQGENWRRPPRYGSGPRWEGGPPPIPTPPSPGHPPMVAGVFGPNGPFGPHGIFGPGGPFGPGRSEGKHTEGKRPEGRQGNREREWGGPTGGVQGWVR